MKHYVTDVLALPLVTLLGLFIGATSTITLAGEVPDAVTASPDVYKVIAENDSLRVIAATWQPGQRDKVHSHPAIGVYILSDCKDMKTHLADGSSRGWSAKSGNAGANEPVTAHSIENVGDTECRLIFFEPK